MQEVASNRSTELIPVACRTPWQHCGGVRCQVSVLGCLEESGDAWARVPKLQSVAAYLVYFAKPGTELGQRDGAKQANQRGGHCLLPTYCNGGSRKSCKGARSLLAAQRVSQCLGVVLASPVFAARFAPGRRNKFVSIIGPASLFEASPGKCIYIANVFAQWSAITENAVALHASNQHIQLLVRFSQLVARDLATHCGL